MSVCVCVCVCVMFTWPHLRHCCYAVHNGKHCKHLKENSIHFLNYEGNKIYEKLYFVLFFGKITSCYGVISLTGLYNV